MSKESIFENIGRIFYRRDQIKDLERQINMAGLNVAADSFAGYVVMNVIVFGVFLALAIGFYPPSNSFLVGLFKSYFEMPTIFLILLLLFPCFVLVYLTTQTLVTTYVLMKSDTRKSVLENSLPDFLMLVASNIKAGMTLDQAMWYSAKPEFGLLSHEVKLNIKNAFGGASLESSLDKLAMRFDSKVFKRTILLLKQASATGGELTNVLERTADDVRNTIIMRKEIAASLVLYEIFVLFAAAFGTPFLFSVATKLIQVFEKLGPQLGSAGQASGVFGGISSFKISGLISASDFFWFSIPTIFVTSLISSFIVSVIKNGSKSNGMKYFPFVFGGSLLVYYLASQVINLIFASLG